MTPGKVAKAPSWKYGPVRATLRKLGVGRRFRIASSEDTSRKAPMPTAEQQPALDKSGDSLPVISINATGQDDCAPSPGISQNTATDRVSA